MGIFRHDLTPAEHAPGTVWDDKPGVSVDLWVPCDRCRVAEAQVEVITDAGRSSCASTTTRSIATRSLRLVTWLERGGQVVAPAAESVSEHDGPVVGQETN